jgi:SAM-dependent methyltransferase
MAKSGERTYFTAIGEENAIATTRKPYGDRNEGALLSQIGTILSLLPNPPAKLLDLGCGTGWTSVMFAKSGYEVIGQDISEDAIAIANTYQKSPHLKLEFVSRDYEDINSKNEFDCAVFFDSLHHAEDETAALRGVYDALKPGGKIIISEPGRGHEKSFESQEAIRLYGVNERDMPPKDILKAAKSAGFKTYKVYPDIALIHKALYRDSFNNKYASLLKGHFLRMLLVIYVMVYKNSIQGVVVLTK